jgi:streptogramin lyase
MSDLKDRLDRELGRVLPARDARAAIDSRFTRRRRRRTVLLPTATLLLTAALVAGLTYAFSPDPPGPPGDDREIAMPGQPIQAMVDGDALWVLTHDPGCEGPVCAGYVVRVDTTLGEITARTPIMSPLGLASGAGGIWVASFADATLLRLDPATANVEATIPLVLPGEEPESDWKFLPTHVDANEDGVWVSTARGAVAHIDPATNSVVDVVPLPPESLGGVAIGRQGVWLDNGLGGLIRVDPKTHAVEEEGSIDDEIGRRLSVGTPIARDGTLWLVGTWGRPVEGLDGLTYESTEREALVQIDERTGEVVSVLDLPKEATWASLLEDDAIWLVEGGGASLRRLDPVTGELGQVVAVPFGMPLAISGPHAWSAVGESIRRWELPLDAAPFVPPTSLEGDVVVMPVTLPDGRTVEIVYPMQLDLASLAVKAVSFAEPTQAPDCAAILYAYHGTDPFLHGEGIPEATYPSASGEPVELWEPPATVTYPEAWLVFSFGSWRVGVPVQGSCRDDDVLAAWARSVTGRETPDGFLVLDMKSPVRTYEPGDPDAPGLIFEDDRFQVQVFSRPCTLPDDGNVQTIGGKQVHRSNGVAQMCVSEGSILVRIEGDDALIDPLIRDIRIRSVSRA